MSYVYLFKTMAEFFDPKEIQLLIATSILFSRPTFVRQKNRSKLQNEDVVAKKETQAPVEPNNKAEPASKSNILKKQIVMMKL